MQSNKEIGKIQSNTPLVIAKALEMFIEDITKQSSLIATRNQDTKINPSHIKNAVMNEEKFLFLKEAVVKIPDLKIVPQATNPYEEYDLNLKQNSSSTDGGVKRKIKAKEKL